MRTGDDGGPLKCQIWAVPRKNPRFAITLLLLEREKLGSQPPGRNLANLHPWVWKRPRIVRGRKGGKRPQPLKTKKREIQTTPIERSCFERRLLGGHQPLYHKTNKRWFPSREDDPYYQGGKRKAVARGYTARGFCRRYWSPR